MTRAVHTFDARNQAEQHRAAHEERTVRLTRKPHGMAAIWALLAAEDATAPMTYLHAVADDHSSDDPRTAEQRRADALTALTHHGLGAANTPAVKSRHGARPSIQVGA